MVEFMKQISVFMLLGKTLLHFCPSDKYEKYIKLLFGFMVVLQFVSPVLSFCQKGTFDEYEKNKSKFEKKLALSLEEVEEKWFLYNEEIEKRIETERITAQELVQEKTKEAETEERQGMTEEEKQSEDADNGEQEGGTIEVGKVKIEVTAHE